MKKYALIRSGHVEIVIEGDDVVDVTGRVPAPGPGWLYTDGRLTPPLASRTVFDPVLMNDLGADSPAHNSQPTGLPD